MSYCPKALFLLERYTCKITGYVPGPHIPKCTLSGISSMIKSQEQFFIICLLHNFKKPSWESEVDLGGNKEMLHSTNVYLSVMSHLQAGGS